MGFIKVAIDLLNASFNKAEKFIEFALTVKGVRPNTFNNASMDNFEKRENRKRPDKKKSKPQFEIPPKRPIFAPRMNKMNKQIKRRAAQNALME